MDVWDAAGVKTDVEIKKDELKSSKARIDISETLCPYNERKYQGL